MPLDISSAEDGLLEATARVKEWGAEFISNWFRPLQKTMAAALWASLTPEQHDLLKAQVPEAYVQVQQMIEEEGR